MIGLSKQIDYYLTKIAQLEKRSQPVSVMLTPGAADVLEALEEDFDFVDLLEPLMKWVEEPEDFSIIPEVEDFGRRHDLPLEDLGENLLEAWEEFERSEAEWMGREEFEEEKKEPKKVEPKKVEPKVEEEVKDVEEEAIEDVEEDKRTRLQRVDLKDLAGIFDDVMTVIFKDPTNKLTDPELADEVEDLAAMFDKYYLYRRKQKEKPKAILRDISNWFKTHPKKEHGERGDAIGKELKKILNEKSHFLRKFKEKGLTHLRIARIIAAYLKKHGYLTYKEERIQRVVEAYLQKQTA